MDPLRFFRVTNWVIGIIDNYSKHDIMDKSIHDIKWISAKSLGDFYADPFITNYFGNTTVFFENYSDKLSKGVISYFTIEDTLDNLDNININLALELPTHLSYPYLFEYADKLYMVPENYQSHSISLYRAGSTPDKWEYVSTMIENFDGVDTTIFQYKDRWWMFSTLRQGFSSSENSELYIWYSASPLDTWYPHTLNPIRYSSHTARSAGTPFEIDGVLYRPTQDCSRTYGGELLINEVKVLNENEFEEVMIKKISGFQPYGDALHTYNSIDDIAVIDGKSNKYSLRHAYYSIINVISLVVKNIFSMCKR